jgi:hypothetical protein
MDNEDVSAYLGLPDTDDEVSANSSSHHTPEGVSSMDDNSQEVMEVSFDSTSMDHEYFLSNQQVTTPASKLSLDNGVSHSPKTTLIATSILQNGTIIYEPIQNSDPPNKQTSDVMERQDASTSKETPPSTPPVIQNIATAPAPLHSPPIISSSDWGNLKVLQDIKMALESQVGLLKAGNVSTNSPQQPQISTPPQLQHINDVPQQPIIEMELPITAPTNNRPQEPSKLSDPVPQMAQISAEPVNNIDAPQKHTMGSDKCVPMDNDNDNVITLMKPGIQVCTLEFNILPVVGTLYVVNNDHNLVKVIYEPDKIYQTDSNGILHRMVIQKDA